jgi:undecaprenyl diphosphate synthase
MDGNNRWARARGENSRFGHRHGAQAARDILQACIDRNIPYLSLFAFSSENWMRPEDEVRGLMSLFLGLLKRKEIKHFRNQGVRFRFIGSREGFSATLIKGMAELERETAGNTGTTAIVAADYGGRWDIAETCRAIARQCLDGTLTPEQVSEELFASQHSLAGVPDPDLCIRTGGEQRISNFLLWQLAYAELHFTKRLWPEFNADDLDLAINDFAGRQRRFGRSAEDVSGS